MPNSLKFARCHHDSNDVSHDASDNNRNSGNDACSDSDKDDYIITQFGSNDNLEIVVVLTTHLLIIVGTTLMTIKTTNDDNNDSK